MTTEQRARRAAVAGGITGFLVASVAVGLLCVANGVEVLPAVGLGTFVGSWGGLGFGAMLAAAVTTSTAGPSAG